MQGTQIQTRRQRNAVAQPNATYAVAIVSLWLMGLVLAFLLFRVDAELLPKAAVIASHAIGGAIVVKFIAWLVKLQRGAVNA